MQKKFLTIPFLLFSIVLFSQDFQIHKQFYGHYDYTMFGNTLNKAANN